jgi:hypothetical protein
MLFFYIKKSLISFFLLTQNLIIMSFKKCKVVMLPTNEKAIPTLLFNSSRNKIELNSKKLFTAEDFNDCNYECFELYILSDDEIKKNDWAYDIDLKRIFQAHKNLNLSHHKHVFKKVIATTDSSLTIPYTRCDGVFRTASESSKSLPQILQSFIQYYVDEYNKSNIITDVLVEYFHLPDGTQDLEGNGIWEDILKVNPKDNTINIKPIKDSWNRDEIIKLLKKFNNDKPGVFNCTEWIEENL